MSAAVRVLTSDEWRRVRLARMAAVEATIGVEKLVAPAGATSSGFIRPEPSTVVVP